jgi:hypothetical protein
MCAELQCTAADVRAAAPRAVAFVGRGPPQDLLQARSTPQRLLTIEYWAEGWLVREMATACSASLR